MATILNTGLIWNSGPWRELWSVVRHLCARPTINPFGGVFYKPEEDAKISHPCADKYYHKLSYITLFSKEPICLSWRHPSMGIPWGIQWLGLCAFMAEGLGSISGWGTKTLKAKRHSQKKKKRKEKKLICSFNRSHFSPLPFPLASEVYKPLCICACALSYIQLFCSPMDCRLPGFSIHGIFQAKILEQVAISFFRGSSWPRDWTLSSCVSQIGR